MAVAVPAAGQQQGYLRTRLDPGHAGVFVDGKYLGPARNFGVARKYALPAGEHEVKLVEPRYEDATQKVTITAGKTTVLSHSLKALPLAKPPYGLLKIVGAHKFSPVYINEKYYGQAAEFDNFVQGLRIPPGDYEIKIVGVEGGASKDEKVKIEANKTTVITVK